MAEIREDQAGAIRNKPVSAKLRKVLLAGADAAGIDAVGVTSGGQDALGHGTRRTGSTRHDLGNAADLELWKGGHALDFAHAAELAVFETFVTAAAANGATGIGAAEGYMGSKRVHVGFGSKAIWGTRGKAVNAPAWLVEAVREGWNNPQSGPPALLDDSPGLFVVNTRGKLNLRAGPDTDFPVIDLIKPDTVLMVWDYAGTDRMWAHVDLENDGRLDGYVFRTFLDPADENEHDEDRA